MCAADLPMRPVPPDYDDDPERLQPALAVRNRHARVPDIHARVAQRLRDEGLTPVLDVGCGEGELARHLPDGAWRGVDSSPAMVERATQAAVRHYLVGKGVDPERAAPAAAGAEVPLEVTKRGALLYARRG